MIREEVRECFKGRIREGPGGGVVAVELKMPKKIRRVEECKYVRPAVFVSWHLGKLGSHPAPETEAFSALKKEKTIVAIQC